MKRSHRETNPRISAIGTGIAVTTSGGFTGTNLDNLRTEIVLKDANDVAFWFSFSFPIAMFREKSGKPDFSVSHQTQVKLNDLFPKRRKYGERIKFGEDESIRE